MSQSPPLSIIKKIDKEKSGMKSGNKSIRINGKSVEVTDEVYKLYTKYDRKMRYFEKDLKQERLVYYELGNIIKRVLSREDSLDKLLDESFMQFEDISEKPNSMEIINTILHPVFTSAVRDGYIRSNPSDGVMADIKKSHTWEKPKRHVLTEQQQTKFVEFTAQSYKYKHWLPLFTVLLGTGGRIGEILGLRWEDCDFPNSIININHTLIYRKYTDEASHFAITTPKTKSGVRIIPMLSDVKAALTEEYKEQLESGFNESVVDGYSGFIFKSRYNTVLSPHCVN
jgi:integrase